MIMTKHVIALYVNEVENLLYAKRLSFIGISNFKSYLYAMVEG